EHPARWIAFGRLSDGDRVLDVGCGTGSLAFTAPQIAKVASVTGIVPGAREFHVGFGQIVRRDRRRVADRFSQWRSSPQKPKTRYRDAPVRGCDNISRTSQEVHVFPISARRSMEWSSSASA